MKWIILLTVLFSTHIFAQTRPPVQYPSFSRFLDSVFYPAGVTIAPINVAKGRGIRDTLHFRDRTQIRRSLGIVKYITVINKRLPKYDLLSHTHFLGLGQKIFADTIRGEFYYRYTPPGVIKYKGTAFIAMEGEPAGNCNGTSCLLYTYPVITIHKRDTQLYIFRHAFNITGLKYADLDHDEALDFIDIQGGLFPEDIQLLETKDKAYQRLAHEITMETYYKIRLLTFKNGKWRQLKDRNGHDYFMIIELTEQLGPDAPFKILMANWIDWKV